MPPPASGAHTIRPNTIDVYKELPFAKTKRVKLSSHTPFTPTYVSSNLTQTSDPEGTYAHRVRGRQMLLENPVRESRSKKEADEKRARLRAAKEKKKRGLIGKREAKEKGIWRLDPSQAKFQLFAPLHHLWMGYMSELLGLPHPSTSGPPSSSIMPASSGMHPKLVKADFHGSIMTVRQSKNSDLVGLSGIVIHETENTFRVVTKKDSVKVIPKENSIFAFAVPLYSTLPASHSSDHPLPLSEALMDETTVLERPHIEFELHGNQFRFRSDERAARKFKPKESIEL